MSEKQLKYGQVYGGENGFDVTLAADQTFYAASAAFVKRTGASTATVTKSDGTDTEILGHLEVEEISDHSTDGTEVRKCVNDPTAVFKVPVLSGTYYEYMKGKSCDLAVSSGIQGVNLDSNTYGQVIIVDGDVDDTGWVLVSLNTRLNLNIGVV